MCGNNNNGPVAGAVRGPEPGLQQQSSCDLKSDGQISVRAKRGWCAPGARSACWRANRGGPGGAQFRVYNVLETGNLLDDRIPRVRRGRAISLIHRCGGLEKRGRRKGGFRVLGVIRFVGACMPTISGGTDVLGSRAKLRARSIFLVKVRSFRFGSDKSSHIIITRAGAHECHSYEPLEVRQWQNGVPLNVRRLRAILKSTLPRARAHSHEQTYVREGVGCFSGIEYMAPLNVRYTAPLEARRPRRTMKCPYLFMVLRRSTSGTRRPSKPVDRAPRRASRACTSTNCAPREFDGTRQRQVTGMGAAYLIFIRFVH